MAEKLYQSKIATLPLFLQYRKGDRKCIDFFSIISNYHTPIRESLKEATALAPGGARPTGGWAGRFPVVTGHAAVGGSTG